MGSLALELGVTIRTICTDIGKLKVDYPIETTRGRNGGVSLIGRVVPQEERGDHAWDPLPNHPAPAIRAQTPDTSASSIIPKEFMDDYREKQAFFSAQVYTFALAVWAHIMRLHITCEQFCNMTLLSPRVYYRLRNNDVPAPKKTTVARIFFGMNLDANYGEHLYELAGYKVTEQLRAIRMIVELCKGRSLYECDEILTALKFHSILPKQYRASQ
jgi:hypothetical protein